MVAASVGHFSGIQSQWKPTPKTSPMKRTVSMTWLVIVLALFQIHRAAVVPPCLCRYQSRIRWKNQMSQYWDAK